MKTAKLKTNRCPNFRHLSLFTILTLMSVTVFGFEVNKNKVDANRAPASAFEEEVLTVPLEQKTTIKSVFAEDDAGVMRGMRSTLSSWESTEDYAKRWHLESTFLYKTPTDQEKSRYLRSNLLRYADKRLAGEMKNAEEGSALNTASKVEKTLSPNASVPVSKYISFKFKARVLEGKAVVEVRNPWVECNTTVTANGQAKVLTKKDFNQLGTSTGVEYNVNDTQLVAFVDQEVTKKY